MKFMIVLAAAAAMLAGAVPAAAQVSLNNKVLREDVKTSSDGTRTVSLTPATKIAPGAVTVYVMTYHNGGAKPATNLVIDNPVPRDVRYAGAGQNSPEPMVSTDHGKTFGRLTDLTVRSASGAQRAAQSADVTNVRWNIAGPVAPGTSGSVSYRGVLQ